ncbi:hypothetical protein ACFQ5N_02935 [Lutibacter holmesii]|uniref:Uncharacterized protein n=1 Tax=Lutibacter holmesii TaxID=1137985 RepID=A0ABW3WN88_9FLAO
MNPFVKRLVAHSKKEDKSGRFIKNGLLEIILFKIAILLALAIYGMYTDHVEQQKVKAYFVSIQHELEPAIKNGKIKNKEIDTLILQVTNCLKIITSPNKDSLAYLQENLGAFVKVPKQIFNFPATKELSSNGYISKIKNKETVKLLRKMQQELLNINEAHEYSMNRYLFSIEPFTNKHMNYVTISPKNEKDLFIEGGPKANYNNFHENMVLWNLLTQKLKEYKLQVIRQREFVLTLQDLKENIKQQVNK